MRPLYTLMLFAGLPVMAQTPPLQADRPDQTETPVLVLKKHFQPELGIVFESGGDEKVFTHPSVLFKYGALDNMELRLIIESQTVVTETDNDENYSGVVPIEAGLKVKLFDEKRARPQSAGDNF